MELYPEVRASDAARAGAARVPADRTARRVLDAWLHGWRRHVARRRLRRRGGTSSVLFVCFGNLYRSPFAAGAFGSALAPVFRAHVRIASAGFSPGRHPAPPEAVAAAARRGVDLSAHRSAPLSHDRVRSADLVVVMDAAQARGIRARFGRARADVLVLGDLDPRAVETRAIVDPVRQPPEVLEASYARIERCARELASVLFGG